jgi:hypothetical protein
MFEDLMFCCSSTWNTFFFPPFTEFYIHNFCSILLFAIIVQQSLMLNLIHSQAQHFILNLPVLTPEPSAHVQVDFHIKIWKGASNVALCNPVCSFDLWEAFFLFQM